MDHDFRFEGLNNPDAPIMASGPENMVKETIQAKAWRYTTSPLGAGLITMIVIFGLLLAIKPPFIQKTPTLKDRESTGIRWLGLAGWSILAGFLVILIEPISNFCKSMMGDKNNGPPTQTGQHQHHHNEQN